MAFLMYCGVKPIKKNAPFLSLSLHCVNIKDASETIVTVVTMVNHISSK